MKISQKIFFVYCAILALFISISGILNIKGIETALFQPKNRVTEIDILYDSEK